MAIRLSDHFTYSKILRFSFPSILMMIFTSLYTIVDGIFVSNLAGADAFAALNLIYPLIGILGTFGFMMGAGGSALISKTLGEGKTEKASQLFSMVVVFELILGVLAALFGLLIQKPVAMMLGASGATLADCLRYATFMLAMLPCFITYTSFQTFFMVAEKPKLALYISLAGGFLNVILDWLFVGYFAMGIFGASLATGLNWLLSALFSIGYFFWKKDELPIHFCKFQWKGRALLQAVYNGSSEMVTNLSLSLVVMLYNWELMQIAGTDGVVAYGIIQYITFLFVSLYLGYSMAMAPVVSFAYGADNKPEMKSLLKKSVLLIAGSSIFLVVLAESMSGMLAGIFVSYSDFLMDMTKHGIQLYSLSFIFTGLNIYFSGFFTALNNGLVSAILSFFRTFLFQCICIVVLPMFFGLDGIWLAALVSESLAIILSLYFVFKMKKRYGY